MLILILLTLPMHTFFHTEKQKLQRDHWVFLLREWWQMDFFTVGTHEFLPAFRINTLCPSSALNKIERICFSEMSVSTYESTRRQNWRHHYHHPHRRKKPELSQINMLLIILKLSQKTFPVGYQSSWKKFTAWIKKKFRWCCKKPKSANKKKICKLLLNNSCGILQNQLDVQLMNLICLTQGWGTCGLLGP
jgi:hypothetical protein